MLTTNAQTGWLYRALKESKPEFEVDLWIQNVPKAAIPKGEHAFIPGKTALISILDPAATPPERKCEFTDVLQVEFLDVDEESEVSIQPHHAIEILNFLKKCQETQTNVVVHCTAGICRSGGVASAAEILGFRWRKPADFHYAPNLLVKRMILIRAMEMDEDERRTKQ